MAGAPPVTVSVSALEGGHLTLPDHLFVADASPAARTTVPSLSFLIRHPTRTLVFDLGLKRDLSAYAPAQQHHITQRHPITTSPDVADSLRGGGLDPARDIDDVLLSHVHWDHVGTPSDFARARFVVGAGTLAVLARGAGPLYPAAIFNADELPRDRTYELPPVPGGPADERAPCGRLVEPAPEERRTAHRWVRLGAFDAAVDFFGDGSVWVLDAPGHLFGHVNVLARVGQRRWVYLGGDCCHDPRILRGEKEIALYDDSNGGLRSVHMDTGRARSTLSRIDEFLRERKVGEDEAEVEVVVAHDKEWREKNEHRFFPGKL
ncbi:beta-lactamase-like protein [Macrophomina phaseolina]|uniref:Beta-lactamase-like protein n=1 Tax=Macrophomina phaseolina TaxID=35725 RepID=A0ABQ8GI00_9PEZI|nr:beta-lactamase-like protein [Macrophomina phaseolina]